MLSLLNHLPGMAYRRRSDAQWTVEFASAGCLSLTGYPSAYLLSHSSHGLLNHVHPEDRKTASQIIQSQTNKRQPYQVTYRLITSSGGIKWVSDQGQGIFSPQGNLLALEGWLSGVYKQTQQSQELNILTEVSMLLQSANTKSEIFNILLEENKQHFPIAAAAFLLSDPTHQAFVIPAANGKWASQTGSSILESSNLAQVIHSQRPLTNCSEQQCSEFIQSENESLLVSFFPLVIEKRVIGILAIQHALPISGEIFHTLIAINNLGASAIHQATLKEQTHRQVQQLLALRTIDQSITSNIDQTLTLELLLQQVKENLNVDAADILLLNTDTQMLEPVASLGFHNQKLAQEKVPARQGLPGQVLRSQKSLCISQPSSFQPVPLRAKLFRAEGFAAYHAAPLIVKGHVRGVLEIFQRQAFSPSAEWMRFLETLAGQAAVAADHYDLFYNLQRSHLEMAIAYDATIEGWARALELRDRETEGHSQRVTEMTLALAQELGIQGDSLMHIRRGAMLHDIGKMGVPDSILLKPGPLNLAEWKVMRQHPEHAYQMLEPISFLRPALDIPYAHHEKWDGSGYPRGIQGEEIPLATRIFTIVDVWDALRSNRPYRPAWSKAQTRKYIEEQSGKLFDPNIAKVFLCYIDRHKKVYSTA